MTHTIVIIGAIAGGANTAVQLRRADKQSRIILLEKDKEIAVSTCGIPYYIGDVVEKRDHLYVNIDSFSKRYDVDVQTQTEATSIDRTNKQVHCETANGVTTYTYDKLILSPGASAKKPELQGMNPHNTFTLHDLNDMDALNHYISSEKPKKAVVVGAGFVGLEMAENFVNRGMECVIVDRSASVLKLVDPDMGGKIQDHLTAKGVSVILEDGVSSFSNHGRRVHLNSGTSIETDLTLLAVGIKPNTRLGEQAGLSVGTTGGFNTNAFMQTNDPNIYAIGDAIEVPDATTHTPRHVALASLAHRQAYIVARHIMDDSCRYGGTTGTGILKIFDLTAGATGLNSAQLDELGVDYLSADLTASSHAGYYPGAEPVTLKILFEATSGKLYSGQVIGGEGADKRLAVLATAIKAELTVSDLTELELGYAPPYSSPKDPVNVIGYKAESKLRHSK